MLLSPKGTLGLEGCPALRCLPHGLAGTAAGGSDAFVFLSGRQNGGCLQGFCDLGRVQAAWHAGLEELPAADGGMLGGRVMAQPAALAPSAAALASCLCRITASLTAVACPCVVRHLSSLQGFPSPPEIHGPSISGSLGCQGFVCMDGSEALPRPHPGALPAPLAGCFLWLCPELSVWSSPTVLPRAPGARVLQSLNPLLRVEPGQGSGEVLPSSRLQQLLPFVLILDIVCPHHCLGFLPGWKMLSHLVNLLPPGHSRDQRAEGAKSRGSQSSNQPGNPHLGCCTGHVKLRHVESESCMPVLRHLGITFTPGRCAGCCLHLRSRALSVVLGWQPALTMKEGVVQEDGALSGVYGSVGLSNCKCITLTRVGPCATSLCQIWGVSTPGPRFSWQWAKGISWQEGRVLCRG